MSRRCSALVDHIGIDVPKRESHLCILAAGGEPSDGIVNALVRALFALRRALGILFRWDEPRHDAFAASYIHRLTDEDRAASLTAPGSRQGPFRMMYLFLEEAVAELRNATVHAFVSMALRPRTDGYTLYWAIYVKPVGRLTRLYMALIDPFRRLLVYPVLIRETRAAWSHDLPPR